MDRSLTGLFLAGIASLQAVPQASSSEAQGQTFSIHLVQGDGWAPLPYETVRGVILVQATLFGQPATVLLDNGTDRTVVDAGLARRAGIELRDSGLGAFAQHK